MVQEYRFDEMARMAGWKNTEELLASVLDGEIDGSRMIKSARFTIRVDSALTEVAIRYNRDNATFVAWFLVAVPCNFLLAYAQPLANILKGEGFNAYEAIVNGDLHRFTGGGVGMATDAPFVDRMSEVRVSNRSAVVANDTMLLGPENVKEFVYREILPDVMLGARDAIKAVASIAKQSEKWEQRIAEEDARRGEKP